MDATSLALRLVLNEVAVEPSIIDLSCRIGIQKVVYLAQASGVDLGYTYGWYVYGPYSAGLAQQYYDMAERGELASAEIDESELPVPVKERLRVLAALMVKPLDFPLGDVDWLELLASVHYLIQVLGLDQNRAERFMLNKETKVHLAPFLPTAVEVLAKSGLTA